MSRYSVERQIKAWDTDEVAQVTAWRALSPPVTYAEIGRRLGRSEQSCRLKLYDERLIAMHGPREKRGTFHLARSAPSAPRVERPNLAICDALFATGGMSTPVVIHQNGVLGVVLLAPNGKPRPAGWRDGGEALSDSHRQHLNQLARWWRSARAALLTDDLSIRFEAV